MDKISTAFFSIFAVDHTTEQGWRIVNNQRGIDNSNDWMIRNMTAITWVCSDKELHILNKELKKNADFFAKLIYLEILGYRYNFKMNRNLYCLNRLKTENLQNLGVGCHNGKASTSRPNVLGMQSKGTPIALLSITLVRLARVCTRSFSLEVLDCNLNCRQIG